MLTTGVASSPTDVVVAGSSRDAVADAQYVNPIPMAPA
jgi:hypothetical protein